MAVDLTKLVEPPSPRITVPENASPREIAEAVRQIDLWTRQTRAYLVTLKKAVSEVQEGGE